MKLTLAALPSVLLLAAIEPAPRLPRPLPLLVDPAITHVSAARELGDGRVLVSDAKKPAVYLLDGKTGRAVIVGAVGAGDHQYVQPGGLYAGPGGTTLLLDRGQARVLTLSDDGRLTGSYSIAVRGRQSASERDVDFQRPDAGGHAYFLESRHAASSADGSNATTLVRFDPVAQQSETVTRILLPVVKTFPGGDGVTFGRQVIGSPEDGWGVVPDGRVAVVRAVPYRVEWHSPDGRVSRGPIIDYDPVPMTEADRRAFAATAGRGPSVGMSGATGTPSLDPGILFAPTKAPFDAEGVLVSPAGRIWVRRNRPASATAVVYDVFDEGGRRIARVEFPAGSRVVGFGPAAIYVRVQAPAAAGVLKKYQSF